MRLQIQPRFWMIVIVLMLIAFGISFAAAQSSLRKGERALAEAIAQRTALQQEYEDLSDALEFARTDDYVIRVARDELGLIMPGEIRYVSGN